MFDLAVMAADEGNGTSSILVFTTGLTAFAVIAGAAITPFGDWLTRKDQLKGYKRNIYRNFLDHGYWFLHGDLSDENRQERAEKYVADWHRIRLIAEAQEVQDLTDDIREPEDFTDERAEALLEAFGREVGTGGLKDPS